MYVKLREKICSILKELSTNESQENNIANLWLQNFWPGEVSCYEEEVRHVNDYLRRQLGLLPIDTTWEREHLKDNVTEEEWLKNFTNIIAPSIIIHGLPDWR